jgi:DNA polymerase-3 subunit gamma/tau
MSYQVLARKWRPRSFASLVGQEHVVRALTHALEQKRLHHAYLFTGTRGVGKTTLARILAKALNCETGITPEPCGKCSACLEIDAGRFVDYIELDAASNRGVDEMTQLLERALYAPVRGRFKVYVIDEVHQLSGHAFNAMLKTLEEPPEHVKFILATTDPQKIPVTVLSRCLQFNLKQMPQAAIVAHLEHIAAEEKVDAEIGGLRLLAAAAHGSMRDSLSLLDQAIAYSAGRVTEADVRAMLGAVDTGYLFDLLEAVADGDARAALAVADTMEGRSLSFESALIELGTLLHRIALAQVAPEALGPDEADRDRILALSRRFDPEAVQLFYQISLHGRQDLPLAPDEYAGFTMTLMRMIAFAPEAPDERRPATRPAQAPASATGARSAAAISAPEAPSRSAAAAFDGDWPGLVRRLPLAGLVRQLGERSELARFSDGRFELVVPNEFKALTAHADKLKATLAEFFGRPVALAVRTGTVQGKTAAAIAEGERKARQDQAEARAGEDPFVRELVSGFDARIDSIKPVEQGTSS